MKNPAVHLLKPRHRRSSEWRRVRKAHLEHDPVCRACGGNKNLQVHHIAPFHLHPELELDDRNLVTLCERTGRDCHFHFGHLFNWHWFNPDVLDDAARFETERRRASEQGRDSRNGEG